MSDSDIQVSKNNFPSSVKHIHKSDSHRIKYFLVDIEGMRRDFRKIKCANNKPGHAFTNCLVSFLHEKNVFLTMNYFNHDFLLRPETRG